MDALLEVRDLYAAANEQEILKGVDLTVRAGEVHILFGPNGSGKSTFLSTLMGLSGFRVLRGEIFYRGESLVGLAPDEIARRGIGLAWQRPPAIRGVRLEDFLRAVGGHEPSEELAALNLEKLRRRELNTGFSGGELKRSEILKLTVQAPDLILLDEPESGVDLENIAVIAAAINHLLGRDGTMKRESRAALIITHTGYILNYVEADLGHIFMDGRIICSGNPRRMFRDITRLGYAGCVSCVGRAAAEAP